MAKGRPGAWRDEAIPRSPVIARRVAPKQSSNRWEFDSLALAMRLLPWMASMQKLQRSGVPEHFSAAKTHESILPRLVTAQRGEVLAMTACTCYQGSEKVFTLV